MKTTMCNSSRGDGRELDGRGRPGAVMHALVAVLLTTFGSLGCDSSDEEPAVPPTEAEGLGGDDPNSLGGGNPKLPQGGAGPVTSDNDGLSKDANDGSGSPGGPDIEALFGGFDVALTQPAPGPGMPSPTPYTSVLGKFADGPRPPGLLFELEQEEAGCQLLAIASPFCDPPCVQGQCNLEDECVPYPQPADVGNVRVEGLGDPFTLTPTGASAVYMPRESPPFPPCNEGDPVRFETEAFDLESTCISPLELTVGDAPVRFKTGEPVALDWEPPQNDGETRIEIDVDLSHHGGTKGKIYCSIADTGTFQMPQELVDGLVELGLSGFPTISIARVSHTELPGRPEVTLTIQSSVVRPLDTGLVSCAGDDDNCPDGLTCQPDFACR